MKEPANCVVNSVAGKTSYGPKLSTTEPAYSTGMQPACSHSTSSGRFLRSRLTSLLQAGNPCPLIKRRAIRIRVTKLAAPAVRYLPGRTASERKDWYLVFRMWRNVLVNNGRHHLVTKLVINCADSPLPTLKRYDEF